MLLVTEKLVVLVLNSSPNVLLMVSFLINIMLFVTLELLLVRNSSTNASIMGFFGELYNQYYDISYVEISGTSFKFFTKRINDGEFFNQYFAISLELVAVTYSSPNISMMVSFLIKIMILVTLKLVIPVTNSSPNILMMVSFIINTMLLVTLELVVI